MSYGGRHVHFFLASTLVLAHIVNEINATTCWNPLHTVYWYILRGRKCVIRFLYSDFNKQNRLGAPAHSDTVCKMRNTHKESVAFCPAILCDCLLYSCGTAHTSHPDTPKNSCQYRWAHGITCCLSDTAVAADALFTLTIVIFFVPHEHGTQYFSL